MRHDGIMATALKKEFELSSSPMATFYMLTNPEFLARKVGLATTGTFDISGTSPDLIVQVSRNVAAELPPIVSKFVGEKLIVDEIQTWHQLTQEHLYADFNLKIANAPVDINGKIKLTGSQSTNVSISVNIKVNVPIFGAAAEPHVVNEINKVLADEELLCRNWIASKY